MEPSDILLKILQDNWRIRQLEGVKSDINVPYRYKYLDFGEKDSENPLQWDEIGKAEYTTWNSNFDFEKTVEKSNKRMIDNEYLNLVEENAMWINLSEIIN